MLKRSHSARRPVADINVVPYIDVMLVLLVIFMITAPLLSQGVNVDLPKSKAKTLAQQKVEPMIVSVDAKGRYYLNVNAQPEAVMTATRLAARVAAQLQYDRQQHRSRAVLVKGDRHTPYGQVVQAMVLLQRVGVGHVGLVTDRK